MNNKLHPPPAEVIETGPAAAPVPRVAASLGRLLLVDDDPGVRESLGRLLETEGYEVLRAGNGLEAAAVVQSTWVDLVLLDLNMPGRNGWDTFEQFTREHPLLPVVIITARANQFFTALSAGAGALLEKPLDIPTLLRTVARLLSESDTTRLARLAGQDTEFHYAGGRGHPVPQTGHGKRAKANSSPGVSGPDREVR